MPSSVVQEFRPHSVQKDPFKSAKAVPTPLFNDTQDMKRLMFRQPGMDPGMNTQGGPYGGFFKDFNPLTPMGQRQQNLEKQREGMRTAVGSVIRGGDPARGSSLMNKTLRTQPETEAAIGNCKVPIQDMVESSMKNEFNLKNPEYGIKHYQVTDTYQYEPLYKPNKYGMLILENLVKKDK